MLKINLLNKSTPLEKNANNSWQDELRNAFVDTSDLGIYLKQSIPKTNFPLFIPKGLAKRIKDGGPTSALWKQFIPSAKEQNQDFGFEDPIGDLEKQVSSQLIHRYKNRALFLPTMNCPVHCRFCFRQHNLQPKSELFSSKLSRTLSYLKTHPEIKELIFSGGDPFILSDDKLFHFFKVFNEKTSISYLRIHTKTLTTLPTRYTDVFIDMLKASQKLFKKFIIVFHCNHPSEITGETKLIIKKLKKANIELLLQSVLLREINDDVSTLTKLFLGCAELGIRPYYLHHPDRVKGAQHFYISIEEGRLIYEKLRDNLPGWAIPHYVVDLPQGAGKTLAYNSETHEFSGQFLSKDGEAVRYL